MVEDVGPRVRVSTVRQEKGSAGGKSRETVAMVICARALNGSLPIGTCLSCNCLHFRMSVLVATLTVVIPQSHRGRMSSVETNVMSTESKILSKRKSRFDLASMFGRKKDETSGGEDGEGIQHSKFQKENGKRRSHGERARARSFNNPLVSQFTVHDVYCDYRDKVARDVLWNGIVWTVAWQSAA